MMFACVFSGSGTLPFGITTSNMHEHVKFVEITVPLVHWRIMASKDFCVDGLVTGQPYTEVHF
jgi:hypothetical protein